MNEAGVSQFDWEGYYESGMASLKNALEQDPEMWDLWTKSDKKYMLICYPRLFPDSFLVSECKVTSSFDFHISSDTVEDLRLLWKSKFIQERYDTTRQHFIVDIHEKKVVEFLSVCM